eukprot:TRINITY_DN2092_c1_g1_i1.p1 TRINITY_DN2092_c1_g1~~TRINITY_DN2092_c1_g1_i1.p1  ORF type:complete len:364 (-),score=79.72 TRINITY_DN2092_c1_g1_i1:65-1156(-)
MSFGLSTQCRHWLFTQERLTQTRQNLNSTSNAALIGPPGVRADDPSLTPKQQEARRAIGDNGITLQEETELRRVTELKIQELCRRLTEHKNTANTAIMFFKRFYLTQPLTQYSSTVIMATCIFLASKVEEPALPLQLICEQPEFKKVKSVDILGAEVPVLEALNFHLICYHPHRPLIGFIHDLTEQNAPKYDLYKLHAHAQSCIDQIMTTDACLIYPPAVISIACLRTAALERADIPIDLLLETRFEDQFKSIVVACNELQAYLLEAKVHPDQTLLKSVISKIRYANQTTENKTGKKRKAASKARAAKVGGKLERAQRQQQTAAQTLLSGGGGGADGEFTLHTAKRRRTAPPPPPQQQQPQQQ